MRQLAIPFGFSAALVASAMLPSLHDNHHLLWSFVAAATCLFIWNGVLLCVVVRRQRVLAVHVVLRKQHYLQACAQGTVLLYWGYYWRPAYASLPLIGVQLLFAYAFDLLLSWSRRDEHTLGFAPFPIVFSTNLFLWFKPEWFWLQFLMIAVGLAAKEFIRWERDGRRVHIFNPSSLPLAAFSLALLLTGTTDITWGKEIASTMNHAPHIYLLIFLVGLPGQFLFGVTTMTMSAVLTMVGAGLIYFGATGVYFFLDAYVPIAVFLGMHLLFTDPSTAPQTELGRIIFGAIYALSVMALYVVLARLGAPTFYDKLLAVPIMNLMIKSIDRVARASAMRWLDPARLGTALRPRQRHLGYMTLWVIAFVAMTATRGVGDSHRGRWVPFWQQACAEDRPNACRALTITLVEHCIAGSGWACNEYGVLLHNSRLSEQTASTFTQGCRLQFDVACQNLQRARSEPPHRAPPRLSDYRIVLRERAPQLGPLSPIELYERGCTQGFADACEHLCRIEGASGAVGCHAVSRAPMGN